MAAMDNATTDGKAADQATSAVETATEKLVPESRLRNLVDQIKELKAQNDSFARAQSEIEAAKKAEAERKALEAQEFDKVLKSRDEEKAAIARELEDLKRQHELGKVERALLASGVSDEVARDGLLTRYEREKPEDVSAWIEVTKKNHPHIFGGAALPTSSGPVGTVSTGRTDSSLQARLKSTDKTVRERAMVERLKLMAEGQYTEGN
jgi:hypothetical protein